MAPKSIARKPGTQKPIKKPKVDVFVPATDFFNNLECIHNVLHLWLNIFYQLFSFYRVT